MDDHFVAALEDQDDGLQQSGLGVEPKSKLPMRPVIIIQGFDLLRPSGCLHDVVVADPVFPGGGMDSHAAKAAKARRMASDRLR